MNRGTANNTEAQTEQQIRHWLEEVPDPEIPVLSVMDLGIVRDVRASADRVEVDVTPTYSGCPATEVIEKSIVLALQERGVANVILNRVLAPPWTTDWITAAGREKLRAYGIAPPERNALDTRFGVKRQISCPRCNSQDTQMISEFGSTACKASYKCVECLEPFEYFKCL